LEEGAWGSVIVRFCFGCIPVVFRLYAGHTSASLLHVVNALYDEMTKPPGALLDAGIDSTVHSHLIAFAAEEVHLTERVVDLATAFQTTR
jgi:hypothetical protein